MSLWTPDGEVPVNRPGHGGTASANPPAAPGTPDLDDLSPAEQAQVEAMIAEMAETQRQILAAPAAVVVANHAMGLFQLAALHLKQNQPDLAAARLAIDTMAGLLDAAGVRLGDDGETLREALTEAQRAYVARSSAAGDDPA
jgi:hypothetical protein